MKKKIFSMFILISALVSLISCGTYIEEKSFNAMGTVITVQLYEKSKGAFEGVKDIFSLYGQLTSSHRRNEVDENSPYYNLNNIYVINENRKVGPIEVREELIELLELSIGLNEETNGYFNIGLGEVTAVWKTLAHNYLVVPKEAYVAALDSLSTYTTPDLNKVIINKENNTVYLDDDKMLLDLGAIAKGYATQLAYDYLKEEKGIKRFKINAGSSSIAIGLPPKGKSIKTYIKDDNSIGEKYLYQDGMLGYIVGGNKHIATSGSAQQSVNVYDDEGYYTKIHHLVSPFTLEPVNTFYKVTLVGDDSILLDVYTTAVFLMTDEDAISFLEEHDIGYILYLFDYSIVTNLSEEDFVQYEIVGEIKWQKKSPKFWET